MFKIKYKYQPEVLNTGLIVRIKLKAVRDRSQRGQVGFRPNQDLGGSPKKMCIFRRS